MTRVSQVWPALGILGGLSAVAANWGDWPDVVWAAVAAAWAGLCLWQVRITARHARRADIATGVLAQLLANLHHEAAMTTRTNSNPRKDT